MQIAQLKPQVPIGDIQSTQIQPLLKPDQLFQKFKTTALDAFFQGINTQTVLDAPGFDSLVKGSRQVKPRMITKLVSWLQKLCKETLEFSTRTLETAVRILLQFLSQVDEPVCNLQLLGCACLYLSSKISESTIVAAQSYVACSMNIFSQADLMSKQAQIYKILDGNTNFPSLYDIYQFITHAHLRETITDSQQDQIHKYLCSSIKDITILHLNPYHVIISILHFVVDLSAHPTLDQVREFAISMDAGK